MPAIRIVLAITLAWGSLSIASSNGYAQLINAPIPSGEEKVAQANGEFNDGELSKGIKQTAWPSIPWPTITMPKITMPKLPPLWPSESTADSPALLQPFAAGFTKVSDGSKKAWEGTKDLFSVFQNKDATQPSASQKPKPTTSIWQRLTTRKKKSDAPQTVGEFMRQPRNLP